MFVGRTHRFPMETPIKMFKNLSATVTALLIAVGLFSTPAHAQTSASNRGNVFAFNDAREYGKWVAKSTASVASGAQTITVLNDAFRVTEQGRQFLPFSITAPILFDQENTAVSETATPSAVTCSQNGTISTCTIAVTFSNAHTGQFSLRSGTYGICEAKSDLPSAGGTVVVNGGFGGTTATITTQNLAGKCGSATVNIIDVRAGNFQSYQWNGTDTYTNSTGFSAGRTHAAKGATIATGGASCVTGDCTLGADGNFFVLSGTTAVDGFAVAGWNPGDVITLETSGSVVFNNAGTVATGFAALALVGAANVSMTSNDLMSLVYDGTVWNQMAPTLVK